MLHKTLRTERAAKSRNFTIFVLFFVLRKLNLLYIIWLYAIALPVILQQNCMENTLAKEAEKVAVKTLRAERAAKSTNFTILLLFLVLMPSR